MGGYKYVNEYILPQYVFFILMSQARWIVLNVLLVDIWIFEFNEIQVQIFKAAMFLNLLSVNMHSFTYL